MTAGRLLVSNETSEIGKKTAKCVRNRRNVRRRKSRNNEKGIWILKYLVKKKDIAIPLIHQCNCNITIVACYNNLSWWCPFCLKFPLRLQRYAVSHRSPFLVPSGLDLHVWCQWNLSHYYLTEFVVWFLLLICAVRSALRRVSCRQGGTGLCKVIGGTSHWFLIRGLCDVRVVGLHNWLVWFTHGKELHADQLCQVCYLFVPQASFSWC
jgi:hypothetical protein